MVALLIINIRHCPLNAASKRSFFGSKFQYVDFNIPLMSADEPSVDVDYQLMTVVGYRRLMSITTRVVRNTRCCPEITS